MTEHDGSAERCGDERRKRPDGDEAAGAYLAQVDVPGTRMARIDLRPSWVGVLDFQSRLPSALGGVT